jgi:hypothetical protein
MFHSPERPTIRGPIEYEGRQYWFCSEACQWIFEREPQKHMHDKTIVDLVLEGRIPTDFEEFLKFSGISDASLGGDLYASNGHDNGGAAR